MVVSTQFTQVLNAWVEVFMRRSMRDFVQFSKESGLSMGQLSTLFRLYHGSSCGVSDLGEHLGVTNAAASQMVDRLVLGGYLARNEHPQDRRSKQLTLTEKGRALVHESIAARRRWMEELTYELAPQDQEEITRALVFLTEAARRLELETPKDRTMKPACSE